MNKSTLALALGQDASGPDEELDEAPTAAPAAEGEGGEDPLAAELDLMWDPESDPVTRAEAFRRAVKAAMQ